MYVNLKKLNLTYNIKIDDKYRYKLLKKKYKKKAIF